jgi:deoxyribonuclease-4
LERAAITAAGLGANTFQIFSSSPRMWRASLPDPAQIRLLRAARERFDLHPLAIHVNYLVNLASRDPVIRSRSIAAFRGEIDRALAIGAEFLVLHPGSFRGSTPELGIEAFVEGLCDAARGVRTSGLTVLIENTAGAGCHLGSRFEELRSMRELAADRTDVAVGFCLDTCHLLAAGFDIVTRTGLRAVLKRAEAVLGLDNVRVIHANDSKCPLGSNADRHQHIGKGHIGHEAFHRILTCRALRTKPFILETPIDEEGDDRGNMDTLKRLAKPGLPSARKGDSR